MENRRRKFIKLSGLGWLGWTGGGTLEEISSILKDNSDPVPANFTDINFPGMEKKKCNEADLSLIGLYGAWANSLIEKDLPSFSYRRKEWTDPESWRKAARNRAMERMAIPGIGKIPPVTLRKEHTCDGLHIEEISWQLPYGRPTHAMVLKPQNASGKLPAILAFHDHGGNKYFGTRKITRTSDPQHPMMAAHQQEYYSGFAWANEIAKRGYVVLVADAFTFASRRVMMQDIPPELRRGLSDDDPENPENIKAYNNWAGDHEHIMAKSLFSAGTTWPGVFFAEDRVALDILSARGDVDASRIGCCGLSGGGLRTVIMGGLEPRIRCAVCVGFMTTWKDFILNKSFTHTWMTYVPLLPNELDFPEILGLRSPLPTLVLNNNQDDLYTLPEMHRADTILKEVYQKAGAPDHYRCSFYPGPHKFDAAMQTEAFGWFDKWLGKLG